jgi:hypothetical protein
VPTTGRKKLQGVATHGPKVLSASVDTFLLGLPTMESTTLPDGYLLPEGMTMADVRRLDRELLASDEGLDVDRLLGKDGGEDDRPAER